MVLNGVPVNYVKPVPVEDIPFDANILELITCPGVLHYIQNVSKVVIEFYYVLKPDGYAMGRESIISKGDWRKPDTGLTKREREILLTDLWEFSKQTGFKVLDERKCMLSLTSRLKHVVSGSVFKNAAFVGFYGLLSALPLRPKMYHVPNALHKLRPAAVYFVLQKPSLDGHGT
jgi:Methyltransferase domain